MTTWYYIDGCPCVEECNLKVMVGRTKQLKFYGATEKESRDRLCYHLMHSHLHMLTEEHASDISSSVAVESYVEPFIPAKRKAESHVGPDSLAKRKVETDNSGGPPATSAAATAAATTTTTQPEAADAQAHHNLQLLDAMLNAANKAEQISMQAASAFAEVAATLRGIRNIAFANQDVD